MSTAKFDTLQNQAGTKSVPVDTVVAGSAKAWVNFNGTGVVAIRAAFNVGSVTDNGVGDYYANFVAPMPDINYVVTGTARSDGVSNATLQPSGNFVTYTRLLTVNITPTIQSADNSLVCAAVFR